MQSARPLASIKAACMSFFPRAPRGTNPTVRDTSSRLFTIAAAPRAPACLVDYSLWDARLRAAGFVRIWYAHDTFAPKTAGWSKNLYHSAWARAAAHTGDLVPGAACTEHKKRYGLTNSQLNCVAEQSEQGTRPEARPEAGPSAAGPSLRQMRELLDAQSFDADVAPP